MTRHGSLSHMASSKQRGPLGWLAPCRMAIASSGAGELQNAPKSSAVQQAGNVIALIGPTSAPPAAHSLAVPKHKTP